MNNTARQFEFVLPARPTNDTLEERLAGTVAEFNEEDDPLVRAELMREIRRLRQIVEIESSSR